MIREWPLKAVASCLCACSVRQEAHSHAELGVEVSAGLATPGQLLSRKWSSSLDGKKDVKLQVAPLFAPESLDQRRGATEDSHR